MSNTLPWRTLATPSTPSDFSAPSMALPWGSRMPDFNVTVTRAFIFKIQNSNRHPCVTALPLSPEVLGRSRSLEGRHRTHISSFEARPSGLAPQDDGDQLLTSTGPEPAGRS